MRRLPLLFGGHSLVRPALRAFFRPDRRCPTPPRARACQGWPRLRGHPLGLGLDWPEHRGMLHRSGSQGPPQTRAATARALDNSPHQPAGDKVTEANLLFEFMIVALNAPAQLGGVNELMEGNIRWKRREPVFGRCLLALRPLDQQPLLRPGLREPVISMRRANPHSGEARRQRLSRAFPPCDLAPSAHWQAKSKLLNRDRLVPAITPQQLWRSPLPRPALWWARSSTTCPYRRLRLDAGHIAQTERCD